MHAAARQGSLEAVNSLINAGANINLSDVHGQTPLHIAAQKGYVEVIKALIAEGAI